MKRVLFLLLFVCLVGSLAASVVLPKVLGSNMVLQRNAKVRLWGWAEKNTAVRVQATWLKDAVRTKSDDAGRWQVELQTFEGSFTPQQITISDDEVVRLNNILIGDVWVCSGQSNMEMPVKGFADQPVTNSLDYILSAAKQADHIRMFTVERARSFDKELEDCKGGQWLTASSKTVSEFSAVAYFFGYTLADNVNVPIGLIATDWGGTRIESWMPLETLKNCVTDRQYAAKLATDQIKPSELYSAMIAPLTKFAAKGFIWYQGESNLADIDHYDKMMAAMVSRWRRDWGDSRQAMPFYYVQIAPYTYGGIDEITYPLFVENQANALRLIPNCGMAGTTDIGAARCIHPPKKFEVGQRLAALALANTYGFEGIHAEAPRYLSHKIQKEKIIVQLSHAKDGLIPWYQEPVTGFEIAGADKVFYPAKASFSYNKPDQVSIWSDSVKLPVAVRYAFKNVTEANLSNLFGIPVVPFRTDHWNEVK